MCASVWAERRAGNKVQGNTTSHLRNHDKFADLNETRVHGRWEIGNVMKNKVGGTGYVVFCSLTSMVDVGSHRGLRVVRA